MTRQHHNLVKQFIDFKDRTDQKLAQADKQMRDVTYLETYVALKSPANQAEHVIDEGTALSLYDSLVPKLREHRRFKLLKDAEFSLADFKIQQKVRSMEYELEKKRLPNMIE